MLKKPYKPCSNCKRELVIDGSYCYNCIQIVEQERKNRYKRYNKEREDKEIVKFYWSSEWRKLREVKKRMNPICQLCEQEGKITPTEIIHHRVEVKDDWSKRLDLSNLVSVCFSCHNKIHNKV